MSKSLPKTFKTHKVHRVTTSLQLFNKVDLQTVMKAGSGSSRGLQRPLCTVDHIHEAGTVVVTGEIAVSLVGPIGCHSLLKKEGRGSLGPLRLKIFFCGRVVTFCLLDVEQADCAPLWSRDRSVFWKGQQNVVFLLRVMIYLKCRMNYSIIFLFITLKLC